MNTKKFVAIAMIGLCSLTALSVWAQTEKYVYINTDVGIITCPVSKVNYIDIFDKITPPANVAASYRDGKIYLSWDEVEGATSYNIYYSCDDVYSSYLEYNKAPWAYNVTGNSYVIDTSGTLFGNFNGIIYFYISANGEGSRSELGPGVHLTKGSSKVTVATLCGYKSADDSQGEVFGSFETTSGFRYEGCMTFDPLYPNRLYIAYDGYPSYGEIVQLDLEAKTHTLLISNSKFDNQRLRNCAFTNDGQYMLVSTDRNDLGYDSPGVWIVKRNADGTFNDDSPVKILAGRQQCNSVSVHPVNGEVYFSSYDNSCIYRIDIDKYFNTINGGKEWTGYEYNGCFERLFYVSDPNWEISISIHPSGNYAYLNCINRNYIYRTDYDWKNKKFTTPYIVSGKPEFGFLDGESSIAKLGCPYQGVFVKNSEYTYTGELDEYDYYFTDRNNYCLRVLSPTRKAVRTIVGRAPYDDFNEWGTEDGSGFEARFRDITGLAYDERTETFYVLDHENRRIRTISKRKRNN